MAVSQWQKIWQRNITSVTALLDFCHIMPADRQNIVLHPSFPISVPERLANKIEKGNINDPLFRQFVPCKDEEQDTAGFVPDPLGEASAQCTDKLLHKYCRRTLILTTQACGMHCRFCFRRHFAYAPETAEYEKELSWLRDHPEIDELILSGGDPFALPTNRLERLVDNVNGLPQIQRLRIHTRFPLGIPERIDDGLLQCLRKASQRVVIVVHVNHPRELDKEVTDSLSRLRMLGIPLLSQTVLLRGVNDTIDTLEALVVALGNAGILPYYLHQLDHVQGTAHFHVDIRHGLHLIAQLRERVSGYLVPQYVREEPGKPCKMALSHSTS